MHKNKSHHFICERPDHNEDKKDIAAISEAIKPKAKRGGGADDSVDDSAAHDEVVTQHFEQFVQDIFASRDE